MTLQAAGNDYPWGIWSDGETMWVVDRIDDKVYAYNMPPNFPAAPRNLVATPQRSQSNRSDLEPAARRRRAGRHGLPDRGLN